MRHTLDTARPAAPPLGPRWWQRPLAYGRASLRLALVAALTLGLCVSTLVLGGSARWRAALVRAWARGTARVLGMRLATVGVPPAPPFLLVANHLSYIDIVALAAHVDAAFVAKSEVAHWPVIGRICASVGTIFVQRQRRRDLLRVNALIAAVCAAGRGVVLFPEGTSTAGALVQPFYASLLAPAARAPMPVHYATLHYRTPSGAPPAHLAVCWWGAMTFLPHLWALAQVPHFEATLTFGPQPLAGGTRKQLAARLHAAVADQFSPLVEGNQVCTTH